jgi:hypothetical protein
MLGRRFLALAVTFLVTVLAGAPGTAGSFLQSLPTLSSCCKPLSCCCRQLCHDMPAGTHWDDIEALCRAAPCPRTASQFDSA